MPLNAKLTITGVIIVVAILMSTVGRTKFRWIVSEEYWSGGKLDPMRWFLFERNGDLRWGGILAFFLAMLALVWIF